MTWWATGRTWSGAGRPAPAAPPSDNREEAARAAYALKLAAEGNRVAVVSSGDPGVFRDGDGVLEAATDHSGGMCRSGSYPG